MGSAWKYIDEVVTIRAAISAYTSHRDERRLARDIARAIYSAVADARGADNMAGVDKTEAVDAVDALVKAFGPAFGLDDEDAVDDDDGWG